MIAQLTNHVGTNVDVFFFSGENLMHQGLRRNHFLKSDIFPTPSDSSVSQEPIHVLVSFERKRLP